MAEIISTKIYNPEKNEEILGKIIELLDNINARNIIQKPNSKILLLTDYQYLSKKKPEISINPLIIQAISDYFKRTNTINQTNSSKSNIYIGINSNKNKFITYLKNLDIKINIDTENIIELNTPVKVKFINGKFIKYFQISEEIYDFDLIINLAKLKTHPLNILSGTTNNLLNLIPEKIKYQIQLKFINEKDFTRYLLDLNQLIKPHLNILECPLPPKNNKKTTKKEIQKNAILASKNSLALDKLAKKIISVKKLPILKEYDEKLNYEIIGDLNNFKFKRKKITLKPRLSKTFKIANFLSKKFLFAKPVILKEKCIGCGTCVDVCPKKCIEIKKKKAQINHKECIHCNSCVEYCIKDAIILRSGKLTKIVLSIKKLFKF